LKVTVIFLRLLLGLTLIDCLRPAPVVLDLSGLRPD